MTSKEFAAVGARLMDAWPASRLETPTVMGHYGDMLAEFPVEHVVAAVESYEAEDRDFAPTAGQVKRRVVEMQLDAPEWGDAWSQVKRLAHCGYTSPYFGVLKGPGGRPTRQEEVTAAVFEAMPLILRHFVESLGRSQVIDNLNDNKNGESRMREKYTRFLDAAVQDVVLAGIEGADDLPRIQRAKRNAPQHIGELVGEVRGELSRGRAA